MLSGCFKMKLVLHIATQLNISYLPTSTRSSLLSVLMEYIEYLLCTSLEPLYQKILDPPLNVVSIYLHFEF